MTAIGWLHLTDLHRGMKPQGTLWGNVEGEFFDDLSRTYEQCGPWDIILFTGDLVQSGDRKEFDALDETLGRLYAHLRSLGSGEPVLLPVPGNHDLRRPKASVPAVKLLKEWGARPEVREEFWSNPRSEYRKAIETAFRNYVRWLDASANGRPAVASLRRGVLPGDFSWTFRKDDLRLGVVGLNSTFLQLGEGDYRKKLAVGVEQFVGVCGEQYNDWVSEHDIRLLLTHQPPDWLDDESRQRLDGEIAVPGRFHAHLCGHMHEAHDYETVSGGAKPRLLWQGQSLFGLETYEKEGGKVERLHGYTAGRMELKNGAVLIRRWPRAAVRHQAGHWRLVANPTTDLEKDGGTAAREVPLERLRRKRPAAAARTAAASKAKVRFRVLLLSTDEDLAGARRAVADHLTSALGVEVTESSGTGGEVEGAVDAAVLLQGWWWSGGAAARAWTDADAPQRLAFVINEDADWPPRRLIERAAEAEIESFRASLAGAKLFGKPEALPESVSEMLTPLIQSQTGHEDLGLYDWERSYLDFRLPAWKAGRTAFSQLHLSDAESAEELYQAELYIPLDGHAVNWSRDAQGKPRRVTRRGKKQGGIEEVKDEERRVPLGRWLSVRDLPRVALVGAPGGGKTVFLTRIAADIANACLGRPVRLESELDLDCLRRHSGNLPVPVVLEATRVARSRKLDVAALLGAMADEFAARGGDRPPLADLERGLKDGRYLLLIDALDEVADSEERTRLLHLLKGIAAPLVFPRTRFVITTRSARYTGRLRFGPQLETVEVAPLGTGQVSQLCARWARYRQRDEEYEKVLMTAVSGLAEQVASTDEDQALTENPLMLTAICMVFERYRSLPDDRGRLCELLIDDLCRSRNSEDVEHNWRLDDAMKKDLLQRIALGMQREGAQRWPVGRALTLIRGLLPKDEKLPEKRAKKYLDWTADHTGLLRFEQAEEGEEQIRFWHRLFREYLCASRVAQEDDKVSEKIDRLWADGRLADPFWEDVIRLLPRALGTIEKAQSMRDGLAALATENPAQRGRLLGLAAAGIIENRDLFPDVRLAETAAGMAATYEAEGRSWPYKDRVLFLDALGRLDPVGGDPRLHHERWVEVPAGTVRLHKSAPDSEPIEVPKFTVSWAPVTVQEYKEFLQAPDMLGEQFWEHAPALRPPSLDVLAPWNFYTQLRHPNRPVTYISVVEALAYCKWRTHHRMDSKIVRLQSEEEYALLAGRARPDAEMERAVRSGSVSYTGVRQKPVGATYSEVVKGIDIWVNVYEWCFKYADRGPVAAVVLTSPRSDVYSIGFRKSHNVLSLSKYPVVGFRCILEDNRKTKS